MTVSHIKLVITVALLSYNLYCITTSIGSLNADLHRRSKGSKTFFDRICHDDSCLHDL